MALTNCMDILRLYPVTEESFREMATTVVNIILAPEEIIPKTDRRRRETMSLLRNMAQFSSCKAPTLLTRVTCLESIYKSGNIDCVHFEKSLKNVSDFVFVGQAVMFSLISMEMKNDILRVIANHLFTDASDEAHTFLCDLWMNKDAVPLTHEFVEELALHFPYSVENLLLSLAEQALSVEDEVVKSILSEDLTQSFFVLCSKSNKVFQEVVTILHQILYISNIHKNILSLIKVILSTIENYCQKQQFVELFPFEQRILVTYLKIPPSLYPNEFIDREFTKEFALSRLTGYLVTQRRIGGALLSYYPEWLPYILEYCCKNDITSLIPPDRRLETSENYLRFILNFDSLNRRSYTHF